MILTCPNCGARYNVRDDALPPGGRAVRCKACAHSWHAEPPVWDLAQALPPGPVAADAPVAAPPEAIAAPVAASGVARDEPRRARRWALIVPLFALAVGGAVAGLGWAVGRGHLDASAVPGWSWLAARELGPLTMPRPAPTALTISASAVNRPVPGGGNVWEVSGTILNTTRGPLPVPPVEVTLMADGGRALYRWQVAPPMPSLAAGRQVRFETATVNTPQEASHVRLALRPAALARP